MAGNVETVLAALNAHHVRYLIAGGVAVVLHGHLRTTAQLADATIRQEWISTKGMTVFSLWNPTMPGFEVDIFAEPPLDIGAALSRSIRAPLDTTIAPVVGIDDLIALKRVAGRPQDLEDIAALAALRSVEPDAEPSRG